MKKLYQIAPDGTIFGLWDDCLAEAGEAKVVRASKVEYNEKHGGWTVEFLIGRFVGCFLPRLFARRKEALEAEVAFLNQELECQALAASL